MGADLDLTLEADFGFARFGLGAGQSSSEDHVCVPVPARRS